MLSHLLRHAKIPAAVNYQLCTLNTLPDKMCDNVVQLCGNDTKAINMAVEALKKGGIIALPTDTVFGLAGDSSNASAIDALYKIKGRDSKKPLAVCVSGVNEVNKYGVTDNLPKGLLNKLLPGPVTVILNRKLKLNPQLNPGVEKVGIRVPAETSFPFIQLVTSILGKPLALTSANPSNEPNCLVAEEFKMLWPKLALVFDTADNKVEELNTSREGSTIVDLSQAGKFKITRNGIAYNQTLETLLRFGLKEFI